MAARRSRQVFDHFDIDVKGAKEVERALGKLDEDAEILFRKEKRRLAKNLAAKLRRAVISQTKISRQTEPERSSRGSKLSHRPMGIRVLPSIKQSGDRVTAGNASRMLFGTEFGMNRKSGWYARPEFANNPHLQYFRHNSSGYWWNPTIQAARPDYEAAVKRVLDGTLGQWSA